MPKQRRVSPPRPAATTRQPPAQPLNLADQFRWRPNVPQLQRDRVSTREPHQRRRPSLSTLSHQVRVPAHGGAPPSSWIAGCQSSRVGLVNGTSAGSTRRCTAECTYVYVSGADVYERPRRVRTRTAARSSSRLLALEAMPPRTIVVAGPRSIARNATTRRCTTPRVVAEAGR